MGRNKPFRIVAAYDSETTNIYSGVECKAFPVAHMIGTIGANVELSEIDNANVERIASIELFRHTEEAYNRFDRIIAESYEADYVPVIMVHNLGFDMYALADYFNRYECTALCKSSTKPITISVLDSDGNTALVFWDTLGFFGKSLEKMGNECGFPKLVGNWNYDIIRTPETPLTIDEIGYCKHDIYVMFAYLGYFLRINPLIDSDSLAKSCMTKTGVVRAKRKALFEKLKPEGRKTTVGRMWSSHNSEQAFTTNDELYTFHACTRGGFTFCGSAHAGYPYDLGDSARVFGFDAASQHPAQMCAHRYPRDFKRVSADCLQDAFELVSMRSVENILQNFAEPFSFAFDALFEFDSLRPKVGTVFAENGIFPLAAARCKELNSNDYLNDYAKNFDQAADKYGYRDQAINPLFEFGKLVKADKCRLWLTELAAWEIVQCYEWDSVKAIQGYLTRRFCTPTDYSLLSVCEFYKRKQAFKKAMEQYNHAEMPEFESIAFAPDYMLYDMANGEADAQDMNAYYFTLKSDLNALFGIEATTESKPDFMLTAEGLRVKGEPDVSDMPKQPKAWYQFGQRIVGWSRIAQNVCMQLVAPHCFGIINGDTDSIKILALSEQLPDIEKALERYATAVDNAKHGVMLRIARDFPQFYEQMPGLGHYEYEFETRQFCAAWNKAYCIRSYDKRAGAERYKFVLAGIPTAAGAHSYNALAEKLHSDGWTFEQVCSLLLGYNVTIDNSITRTLNRKAPKWGSWFSEIVTDYHGVSSYVNEPAALALFDMSKTIGCTDNPDNAANFKHAKRNNPNINEKPALIIWPEFCEYPDIINV